MARGRTIGSYAAVMTFYENLTPLHLMDIMGAYLYTLATGDTVAGSVKPVFSNRVPES